MRRRPGACYLRRISRRVRFRRNLQDLFVAQGEQIVYVSARGCRCRLLVHFFPEKQKRPIAGANRWKLLSETARN